jgi:hypothetical protein
MRMSSFSQNNIVSCGKTRLRTETSGNKLSLNKNEDQEYIYKELKVF